ncbi:HAD family hydrolase [Chengkuizengella axinellae]|uniref:HAD-IA family hydrolase n=1 Tax=Chengkuizengella axinellae TaxID=3064388 RepID=A0ABT9IXX9_9BACL|nr:HAD-IA family hydrolase [Chengkuizengella sp. 2205SS18-9]MDP5274216.1 HAD-IA family hydrolase [Chengkuizengella sp. 2205SS18-9]
MKKVCHKFDLLNDVNPWESFWEIYQKYNSHYWKHRQELNLNREAILEHSFEKTLNKLNFEKLLSKSLADHYWSYFCSTYYYEENAIELISYLHPKYSLGLITNGYSDSQRKRLEVSGLIPYLSSIVISDEVKVMKPNKQIFDISFTQLNRLNDEVLYIGDSILHDFQGAKNAEIDFCFYNRNNLKIIGHEEPKYIINSLEELFNIL